MEQPAKFIAESDLPRGLRKPPPGWTLKVPLIVRLVTPPPYISTPVGAKRRRMFAIAIRYPPQLCDGHCQKV